MSETATSEGPQMEPSRGFSATYLEGGRGYREADARVSGEVSRVRAHGAERE